MSCCNWTNKFLGESEAMRINRLKRAAKELLAEEQAGFRAGGTYLQVIKYYEYSLRNTCYTTRI
ncbi:hypothetical protein DPMN_102304 [Dreissena polymorpha]|uniref:Uncharacterized protein n=1 Tax=Dreissena polymorpha TaxID=45954 RepID=A0A9D4RAE4_DREPO|nr:hypothetical protein DPMN_102304 [Dreissena polymorpha]